MERRLSNRQMTRQSGYALILMVVGLMGIGGVAIVGFTQGAKQDAEHQRYLHNQRILREAKQALLQYAYNYPAIDDIGPGRLPNADTDNNGLENGGSTFGRLPWANSNLNLYDIRDADGQRLWYAVSSTFRPQAAAVNSDTSGTITLRDQSGGVIFDGSNAADATRYGVAAVIIAPGAVIDRNGVGQDRSVANSDNPFDSSPDTDPGIITASNYLDLVAGTEDNSGFTNGHATDGLILGPVNDLTNDQFIVITAAEVIAMAEKAALQAYREAIRDYLGKTVNVYPWLYNYRGVKYVVGTETVDVAIDKLSTFFPAGSCSGALGDTEAECVGNGGTWDASFANEKTTYLGIDTSGNDDGIFGRIPAMFGEYFGSETSQKIDSGVIGEFEFNFSTLGAVGSSGIGNVDFDDDDLTLEFNDSVPWTDIGFVDLDGSAGEKGGFTATLTDQLDIPLELYFRGAHNDTSGVFSLCPGGADEVSDCDDSVNISVLRVSLVITIPAGTISIDTDHASNAPTDVVITSSAAANSHARIQGKYDLTNALLTSNMPGVITVLANYDYDAHYHVGYYFGEHAGLDSGTLTMDDLLLDSNLTIGMRYFPELPGWAFTNDWHNSIRMAYALEYEPPGTGPCIVDITCMQLDDFPGKPRETISLLVIGGQHDWTDTDVDGELADEMADDRGSVFDNGNTNDNETFYHHRGNDKMLVIDRL